MANTAQEQMKNELGEGYEDLDWKKLDPRQYDPRRIIREALLEDDTVNHSELNQVKVKVQPKLEANELPPYDGEST